MPVVLRLLALCLPLALASPVAAQERSARFLQLMSYLPDPVIANRSELAPEYVDFDAAAAAMAALVATGAGDVPADGRRSLGGPLAKAPEGGDWSGKVGFSRADVQAAVGIDDPGNRGMILLLPSEVIPQIGPSLLANGYVFDDGKVFPVYWRGEEDLMEYMDYRSPDDPFTYPLPKSSRIALDGSILMQSTTWPGLEAMFASPEVNPVLAAFGRVLDLPDWGQRQLLHATIFSNPTEFAPAFRVGSDLNLVNLPPGGVPYWSNLLLADLSDGANDLTLIVLVYSAKSDAEQAAAAMEAGLGAMVLPSFGDKALGDLIGPGRAMVTGEGPYAAVYAVETKPEVRKPRMVRNQGYHVLRNAAFSRELSLLGPLMP
ncbi:hypothetical protein [Tabrizicola sp.]|uniref:hypothetical protein n=1 Tax=Tabrizicola sp. TaxID=2005166 RepID=UPI003F3606E6